MQQFLRNTRVVIGTGATGLEIKSDGNEGDVPGLRVTFQCVKNQLSARVPNSLTLSIYNLSAKNRARIKDFGELVSLEVGYGGTLRSLFLGKLMHVIHEHQDTEWITTIYCWDKKGIGISEATIDLQVSEGTTVRKLIEQVIESFGTAAEKQALIGIEHLSTKKLVRPWGQTGATKQAMDTLAESYGFTWGFQDNRLEIRGNGSGAAFTDDAVVISSATGMVGSPIVTDRGVEVTTLLNPAIRVWRKILIKSVGAGVRVGQIETRELIPTLHTGTYIVGEVVFDGDTWGDAWTSRVSTFTPETSAAIS